MKILLFTALILTSVARHFDHIRGNQAQKPFEAQNIDFKTTFDSAKQYYPRHTEDFPKYVYQNNFIDNTVPDLHNKLIHDVDQNLSYNDLINRGKYNNPLIKGFKVG